MKRSSIIAAVVAAGALAGCGSDLVTGGPLLRPGEPTGGIRIMNVSGDRIDAVLISTCSASTYGLNRLPRDTSIPSGGSYTFSVSAGCWDVSAGTIGYGDGRRRLSVAPGEVVTIPVS